VRSLSGKHLASLDGLRNILIERELSELCVCVNAGMYTWKGNSLVRGGGGRLASQMDHCYSLLAMTDAHLLCDVNIGCCPVFLIVYIHED